METFKNITTRRSVKRFKSDEVPSELIEKIVNAATNTASGMNRQAAKMIVITNKELRNKLSEMNAKIMGVNIDPFYNAPVIIVVLADKNVNTYLYDGSLVLGNLMTLAHDSGLGSCWIHRAKEEFESEEGKKILNDLGIVGDYEGIGHLALGYIDGDYPTEKSHKEDYIVYVK